MQNSKAEAAFQTKVINNLEDRLNNAKETNQINQEHITYYKEVYKKDKKASEEKEDNKPYINLMSSDNKSNEGKVVADNTVDKGITTPSIS